MRNVFILVVTTMAVLTLTACTPRYRLKPGVSENPVAMKTVVLLEPDITIKEASAGGVEETVKEWSRQGTEAVTQAIVDALKAKAVEVKVVNRDDVTNGAEVKEILNLYAPVCLSILMHTYNKQSLFPAKVSNFDYSIGSIESLLKSYHADGLVYVTGEDTVSTAGRKAVTVVKVFTGIPVGPTTSLVMALADKNGDLLWFGVRARDADLRDKSSAASLVADTMEGFPEPRK